MSITKQYPLPAVGIDMMSNETSLDGGTVRSAVNVDIGRAGQFRRRDGYTRLLATPGLHSLYHASQKGWTFVAQNQELFRLDPINNTLSSLAPLNSPERVWYTEYNGNVYFTNRTTIGWVPAGHSVAMPVGLPIPPTPTLSPADGPFLPGKYAVTVTLVNGRGEEGGAAEVQVIDLPNGGGIRLTDLPQRAGWEIAVYVTSTDGDVLRHAAVFPAVFPTYVLADTPQGAVCGTAGLAPMPPGEAICWHNGRLFTARDGALRFSEALSPHLHNPAHGVIPFSGTIRFMESVGAGIFVGDDRGAWYLAGEDPSKFEQKFVSRHVAVTRSSLVVPADHFPEKQVQTASPVAMWLSTNGYIVGLPGGDVVELHGDRVKVPGGMSGRSVFLTRGGRKQVVTPVNSTTTAPDGTAVDSVIT